MTVLAMLVPFAFTFSYSSADYIGFM